MIGEGDQDDDAIDTKLAVIKSEEQILKKLKQSPVLRRNRASLPPSACAKLMFALQQASYFDLDTFLDLESRLLQSLSEGSVDGSSPLLPSHLVLAFQAHSSWAEMLIQESKNDKK